MFCQALLRYYEEKGHSTILHIANLRSFYELPRMVIKFEKVFWFTSVVFKIDTSSMCPFNRE